MCCRYTTTPECRPGVCVSIVLASWSCSPFPVVALRVELSATRLSAVFGQPALDYHCQRHCRTSRDGRTRTCVSVLPKHVGSPLPYIPDSFSVRTGGFEPPISWSPTRRDTRTSLRSVVSDPYRSRTGLVALKGQCPRTDRRTGLSRRIFSTQLTHGVARTFHAVGRAVLESASPGFQPGATPSQLPTQ